jgi:hypothetical protein
MRQHSELVLNGAALEATGVPVLRVRQRLSLAGNARRGMWALGPTNAPPHPRRGAAQAGLRVDGEGGALHAAPVSNRL